jgi:hypothetical protein
MSPVATSYSSPETKTLTGSFCLRIFDVDADGGDRVGGRLGVQVSGRNFEVIGQQLGERGQVRDAAVGVVQDRIVDVARARAARAGLDDLREHLRRPKCRGRDPPSDVADRRCLAELEPEHVGRVDTRAGASDDRQTATGHELEVGE